MSADSRPYRGDLDAIQARLDALTSDDWSGYADDLGDYAGRCELYAGPWVNGYRTGSVFAISPDCDCGCHPPTLAEMHFIASARADVPALLAEVRQLRTALISARVVERLLRVEVAYLAAVARDSRVASPAGGHGMGGSGR